jgi:electron-transferring-flavoprotein dehydrogenase
MDNHGAFIVPLGEVTRWLAARKPPASRSTRFAAAEVLYEANGEVAGVATGDMGVGKDGKPKDSFTRHGAARQSTLFAEGAREPDQAAHRALPARRGREPQKSASA